MPGSQMVCAAGEVCRLARTVPRLHAAVLPSACGCRALEIHRCYPLALIHTPLGIKSALVFVFLDEDFHNLGLDYAHVAPSKSVPVRILTFWDTSYSSAR